MRSFCDIQYGKLGHTLQKLDVHLPDEGDSFPAFVYFHGGGMIRGDKAGPRDLEFAKSVTKKGVALISVNYRMYPDAKYPDFVEDAAEATAWVLKSSESYFKCKGVYVGGCSAGGYLSMMLCFDKRWLAKFDASPLDVKGFIHDGGQPTAHFNVLKERGIDERRVIVDETAPLYHIGTNEEYPPMLFLVSDHDMENRYEQLVLTVSTLKYFGHTEPKVRLRLMPNTTHCKYGLDENGDFVLGNIICEFIKENP